MPQAYTGGAAIRPPAPVRCGLFLLLLATLSFPAAADSSGTLRGRVTDGKGRPIGGAMVSVRGEGAVGRYEAVTDDEGRYRIPGLPLHEALDVRAESAGLGPVLYAGVVARGGSGTRRDFRLRPAESREWLVAVDRRVPFHDIALAPILESLTPVPHVLEVTTGARGDALALEEATRLRPSAVIAIGDVAARLSRRVIRDVPVVYTMVVDPEGEDLLAANICGLRLNDGFEDPIRSLRALRPEARRVATVYDPRSMARDVGALREALHGQGFTLASHPVRSAVEVESALATLAQDRPDAFYLLIDPDILDAGAFERIRRFTSERAIPLVVPDRSLVAVGGTFSYAPGFAEMGAHAARIAGWIASGRTTPEEVGVRFPTIRYFSLNPFEAGRLGISVPGGSRFGSLDPGQVENPSTERIETP